jgi:hypothetical protein
MYSGGYAGKILRINLSNRTSTEERLSEESELGYTLIANLRSDLPSGTISGNPCSRRRQAWTTLS